MEGFLVFLIIVIAIVITLIVAAEFSAIAAEKGYYESKFFWYTLLFGIAGMLIIIALPDRRKSELAETKFSTTNEKSAYSLSSLAKERENQERSSSGLWNCQHCGTVNNSTSCYCKDCGKYR